MKRIIPGVRNIGDRAATLRDAALSAARRMEDFRQDLNATTNQLESLKSEMPLCVADLRTDREDRLSAALLEIKGADELFAQAGYELEGLDLEISPAQRVIIHLVEVIAVEPEEISRLMQSQPPGTLRAVLSALARARATAATIAPEGLPDRRVVIGLGPIPSVRLSWRDERSPLAAALPSTPPAAASAPVFASVATGSFFDPPKERVPEPPASTASAEAPAAVTAEPATPPQALKPALLVDDPPDEQPPAHEAEALPVETTPAAPEDPLARFKKMPILTR